MLPLDIFQLLQISLAKIMPNGGEIQNRLKLYQFMGKDNIPFHTVMFPSSLIAANKDWTLLHHISTT